MRPAIRLLPALFLAGGTPLAAETPLAETAPVQEAVPQIALEQDYDPSPAMWLLQDDDTTIYLFGTVHVLREGFRWRSPEFNAVVEEADELVLEMVDGPEGIGDDEDFETALLETIMSEREPTSLRLSPENVEKWRKLIEMTGAPFEMADTMHPLMAMMGSGLAMLVQSGSSYEHGVETIVEAEFREAGKSIMAIEDPFAVMQNFLAIDEDIVIEAIDNDLSEWSGDSIEEYFEEASADTPAATADDTPQEAGKFVSDEVAEDVADEVVTDTVEPDASSFVHDDHEWARGNIQEDEPLFGDSPLEVELSRVLIEDRNRAWAGWLADRLDQPGTVLVAVGAGHFTGPYSVQNMLAERELTVTRVQ